MDTHITPHKIKAEWTRSSTHEALEESNNEQLKTCKIDQETKGVKIKILEQIVIKPGNDEVHYLGNCNESSIESPKSNDSPGKKKEESRSKKCQICEKSFQTANFEEHVKSHSFFECTEPDCLKKFKRKSSLRKHMYIHKGKFKYECEDCKLKFVDKCKYQIHIASKHKKVEQVYECKECDKTFNSADYLRRHQITHKDEYPYPCTMCSQKFKWFTSLQTHVMIHTQNKAMVQCHICLKRFFTQRTLDRHIKIHQNLKYHCKICKSIVSIRKDNIMRHIRHLHSEISRSEIPQYIVTSEALQQDELLDKTDQQEQNEPQIIDDFDDESHDLIIDDSVQEEVEQEVNEIQQPIVNNRVNVIQSIGNPNKNQQQSPQSITTVTTDEPTDLTKTDELSNNNHVITQISNKPKEPEKIDDEIKLPPKKKAIAKYNPIEHYRKILGLSESNTSSTSKVSEESSEQVFPDHWRKRTSQNFRFH